MTNESVSQLVNTLTRLLDCGEENAQDKQPRMHQHLTLPINIGNVKNNTQRDVLLAENN